MSLLIHRGNFKKIIKNHPINSILVLVNTLLFLYTLYLGGFSNWNLYQLGAIHKESIEAGEYDRLLKAIFLHGSPLHFVSNTFFGIAILGAALERLIGSVKYLFVYLASGLMSSYIVYLTTANNQLTLGASGAIYGVLGVFLFFILFKQNVIPYSSRMELRNLILINILFTFLVPYISVVGHLSGLVTGFILAHLFFFNKD